MIPVFVQLVILTKALLGLPPCPVKAPDMPPTANESTTHVFVQLNIEHVVVPFPKFD